MYIRQETEGDAKDIRIIQERAFGRSAEANLVEALRDSTSYALSLVILKEDVTVGHILFTEATLHSQNDVFPLLGLGPMAVLPEYQNQGMGSRLIRHGMTECSRLGHDAIVVLGHPKYYPRFGFLPARSYGITCEFRVPPEAFMVCELRKGALRNKPGIVKYAPAFRNF